VQVILISKVARPFRVDTMSLDAADSSSNASMTWAMACLKSRDAVFLESLFFKINPILLKILASNGVFAENAEDLVHQTWERFFTNLDKFEGRSEIQTFVCGILLNKIREYRRANKRMVYEEDSELVMARAFTEDGWWVSPPPAPDDVIYSAQISTFINECLDGLSELQRSAFILKEIEGQDSFEICNNLGVSVSNLRVLIFRAKDKLRQCLEGRVAITKTTQA
jgi:RNA polymerase sigma-70 factor (ECF subfamily)